MDTHLPHIAKLLEVDANCLRYQAIGGGCISRAMRVIATRSGEDQSYFVKVNQADFLQNFTAEADGLRRLGAVKALRVPQPLVVQVLQGHCYFVSEWVETAPTRAWPAFYANFGISLATLHKQTSTHQIGLDYDNYLGSAHQVNTPGNDWIHFVADHRLGYQLRWGIDQGAIDRSLKRLVQSVIDHLPELLAGREDCSCLLHGDLWSGNYLCDDGGTPTLIDPAVYYGCREAEFGMIKLFGSCPQSFYDAYQATWPMPTGWERRVDIYVLYHLLNHLNLFGHGYHSQCEALASAIVRSV